MREYPKNRVCGFRYSNAKWGELSNFCPLPSPIAAGPWTFDTSEHLYQAAKRFDRPDLQKLIANAPTARAAAAIGRDPKPPLDPAWNAQRVDVMRWVLRMKREHNPSWIDGILADTGDRPIVEISSRDPWWGATPALDTLRGHNVLGRLWMELRQQLRDRAPLSASSAWTHKIRAGALIDAATPPLFSDRSAPA